jgi:hypothetical protein
VSDEIEQTEDEWEDQGDRQEKPTSGWVMVLAWLFILAALAGIGLLFYRIYPDSRPAQSNPDFIDIIFANSLVVFASRLVLISGAVVLAVTAAFIVYSMAKRMVAGELLAQFGPLKVPEVADLSSQVETLQDLWVEADEENAALRARLENTDALFAELWEEYQQLAARLGHAGEEEQEPPGGTVTS